MAPDGAGGFGSSTNLRYKSVFCKGCISPSQTRKACCLYGFWHCGVVKAKKHGGDVSVLIQEKIHIGARALPPVLKDEVGAVTVWLRCDQPPTTRVHFTSGHAPKGDMVT